MYLKQTITCVLCGETDAALPARGERGNIGDYMFQRMVARVKCLEQQQ